MRVRAQQYETHEDELLIKFLCTSHPGIEKCVEIAMCKMIRIYF